MANKIKGITIEIAGETTKLQSALKDVNKQSKNITSELKQVEKGLKFNPKSTELIAQKQKLLGDQVATTREKLDKLKDAEKQVQQQFERGDIGEEQYRAFRREIVETESKLKHYEGQLREVSKTKKTFAERTSEMSNKLKEVGSKMTSAGQTLSKKLTAPIVGAAGAVVALGVKMGNTADEILDLSSITGMSTDAIQEWRAVADRAGVSADAVSKASEMLVKSMARGAEGSADMRLGMEKLGLSMDEVREMSPDERMETLVKALQGVENASERAEIGQKILRDGYRDLAPILDMTAAEMQGVIDQAHETGRVMGEDSLNSANDFRMGLEELKTEFQGVFNTVMGDIMPMLNDKFIPAIEDSIVPLLQSFGEMLGRLIGWFSELDPKWQKIILAVTGLVIALGPILTILGPVISMFGTLTGAIGALSAAMAGGATGLAVITTAFPALGAVITALTGPIGIVVAAITGLVAIGWYLYNNWDEITEWFVGKWKWVKDKIGDAIEGAVKWFRELPGRIWKLLRDTWNRFNTWRNDMRNTAINASKDVFNAIVNYLKNLPRELLNIGRNMISNFAQGIRDRISSVTGAIGEVAQKVRNWLPFSPAKEGPLRDIPDFTAHLVDPAKVALKELESVMSSGMNRVGLSLEGAVVAGGAGTSIGNYRYGDIVIQNMSVRSDQDIKMIARELHTLQQQSARGRGMR